MSTRQVSTFYLVADQSCWVLGQNFTYVAQVPAPATKDDASEEESEPLTNCQKKDRWNARDKARRQVKWKAEAFMAGVGGKDSKERASKKKKRAKKSAAKEKGTKAKKMIELWDEGEDEDEDLPKKFMVYLDIEATAGGSCSKLAPPPLTIKRSLFFHETNQSFTAFKKSIDVITPCNPKMIVLNSLTWKFETPMNGPRHPLPNEVGYKAMIEAVWGKKGASVIFVYMTPPKKDTVSSPTITKLRSDTYIIKVVANR